MYPAQDSKDAQGNDLQIGTNCLAPRLLYQLLSPLLNKTGPTAVIGTVRVLWAASIAVHVAAPKPHGMEIASDVDPRIKACRPTMVKPKWAMSSSCGFLSNLYQIPALYMRHLSLENLKQSFSVVGKD